VGLPLPSALFLVAAGGLAGSGALNGAVIVALATVAAMAADLIWFQVGRWQGFRVLALLCKISLEPDTCKRKTEQIFARHGLSSLLVVKFIPGLSTVAPPLAGITGAKFLPFFIFNLAGALIWVGTFVGLGAIFSDQLERIAGYLVPWAAAATAAIITLLLAYIAYQVRLRALLIRRLRMARVRADELREMMEAGVNPPGLDLRHPLDLESFPYVIPGAVLLPQSDIETRSHEIPEGQDVIAYCS